MFSSHINQQGRGQMVDVGHKKDSQRIAIAKGTVKMKKETIEIVKKGMVKKGDVLAVAQVAGIMGAKNTSGLIPMCHNIALMGANIKYEIKETEIEIEARINTLGKTGAEMEALTAVSLSALTIYDMCKSHDRDIIIKDIRLMEKSGGKSGNYIREEE